MKIIICSSITAAEEVIALRDQLQKLGHEVEIPEGVKSEWSRGRTEVNTEEKAQDKIQGNLIRGYYEKMKNYDSVLIVNPEKRGVKGYIGGNTFIEMAFAHVLDKNLYVMYPIPDMPYTSEILAMQPIVINGDLSLLV